MPQAESTEATRGTNSRDQAIWIESKDSVGFSVGFNCTAYIKEGDTAHFLYMYRSKSLAQMMDGDLLYRRDHGLTVFELILPRSTAV